MGGRSHRANERIASVAADAWIWNMRQDTATLNRKKNAPSLPWRVELRGGGLLHMDHITTRQVAQEFLSLGGSQGGPLVERTAPGELVGSTGAERIGQGVLGEGPRADPPLLTGGSWGEHTPNKCSQEQVIGLINHLAGVSVDWLTITTGPDDSVTLMALSELDEPGLPKQGFRASERRLFHGGQVWRRFEARQESRRWGASYESWECSGGEAGSSSFASICRSLAEARPTRVDIAFDLDTDMTADEFVDLVSSHVAARGLTTGISGQGGVNTRYVGSASSDRRLRVYRKDWQSDAWLVTHGRTLRVELILKGDQAAAWWSMWREDKQLAYRAAAAHVADMTGAVLHEVGELPEVVPVEGQSEAAKLAAFFQQYGPYLDMLTRAGFDIQGLCKSSIEASSSESKRRISRRLESIQQSGVDLVSAVAERIIFS